MGRKGYGLQVPGSLRIFGYSRWSNTKLNAKSCRGSNEWWHDEKPNETSH